MVTIQAFNSASNASALALTWSTTIAWETQRSIRPFIMSTPCKHPKPELERINMQHDGKERQTDTYLSQTKETRLPNGLIRMVVQVLIVFTRDDKRELLKSVLRIFAKEDGAFFIGRNLAHH